MAFKFHTDLSKIIEVEHKLEIQIAKQLKKIPWYSRFLLFLLGFSLTLPLIGFTLIKIDYTNNILQNILLTQLSETIYKEIHFRITGGNLITNLILEDIVLSEGLRLSEGTFAKADKIILKYNLLDFLAGNIVLQKIIVEYPTVRLIVRYGAANIEKDKKPKPPIRPSEHTSDSKRIKKLVFKDVSIIEGQLFLDVDPGVPFRNVDYINIETSFTYNLKSRLIDIYPKSGDMYLREPNLHINQLNGHFYIDEKGEHFEDIIIGIDNKSDNPSILNVNGYIFPSADSMNLYVIGTTIHLKNVEEVVSWYYPPLPEEKLNGIADFEGCVCGKFHNIIVDAKADIKGAGIRNISVEQALFKAIVWTNDDSLSVKDINILTDKGEVNGSWDFNWITLAYNLIANTKRLDLADILNSDDSFLQSSLSGDIEIYGSGFDIENADIYSRVNLSSGKLATIEFDSISTQIQLKHQVMTISESTIGTLGGLVHLIGNVTPNSWDLSINSQNLNLQKINQILPLDNLSGSLHLEGLIEGDFNNPDIHTHLEIRDGAYKDIINFDFAEATCSIYNILENPIGNAKILFRNAELLKHPILKSEAIIKLDNNNLIFSPLIIKETEENGLECSAKLTFTEDNTIQIECPDFALDINQEHFTNSDTINIIIKPNEFMFQQLELEAEEKLISLNGIIDFNGKLGLDLDLRQFDIAWLIDILKLDFLSDWQGNLSLQCNLHNTLKEPQWSISTRLDSLAYKQIPIGFLEIIANYKNHYLTVDSAIWENALNQKALMYSHFPIDLSFTYLENLENRILDDSLYMEIKLEDFEIATFTPFWDIERNVDIWGYTNSNLKVTGTPIKPIITLEDSINNLTIKGFAIDDVKLAIDYYEEKINVKSLNIGNDSWVRGTLPCNLTFLDESFREFFPLEEMDFEVYITNLDLGLWSIFIQDIANVEGFLDTHFKMNGTLFNPLLYGEGKIHNGQMRLPTLLMSLNDIEGNFKLEDNYLYLLNIEGNIENGGSASMEGKMELNQFLPKYMEFNIIAKDIAYNGLKDINAIADAELQLKGTLDDMLLNGEIQANEGLITMELAEQQEAAPINDKFDIDISIKAPTNIWLRNSLANIEMDCDLRVRIQDGHLFILGELNMLRGVYYFLDTEFTILEPLEKASFLQFMNSAEINPQLDISAETNIKTIITDEDGKAINKTIRIVLHITGTALKPRIEVSTPEEQPPYSQRDIATLITLGTTWNEMSRISGSEAGAEIGDKLKSYFENKLAKEIVERTWFDSMELDTNIFGTGGEEQGLSVTLGKRVHRKLFVSYSQDLRGSENFLSGIGKRVKVEYFLSDYSSFVGETDGENNYSLDLKVKYRY